MHEEWSKARVRAVLAALEDAGMGRRQLSEISGVDHSTIGRWARGNVKPGYAGVRNLARGIWQRYPDLARELVEASGYAWAEPAELPPRDVLAERWGQDDADAVRRILRRHPDGEAAIRQMEQEFSAPGAGQSESGPLHDAG